MIRVKYDETVVTSRGNTQIFVNDFITDYVLRGVVCDLNDPVYSGSIRKGISLCFSRMHIFALSRREKKNQAAVKAPT